MTSFILRLIFKGKERLAVLVIPILFTPLEGHGKARLMTQRNEMLKTVQNFHDSFRQLYLDLTYKSVQELRRFEQERNRRKQSRKNAWT